MLHCIDTTILPARLLLSEHRCRRCCVMKRNFPPRSPVSARFILRQSLTVLALLSLTPQVSGFAPCRLAVEPRKHAHGVIAKDPRRMQPPTRLSLSVDDQALATWIVLFSVSHIGMSSIRDRLITFCGEVTTSAGLVGTGLSLPTYWPGDEAGNQVFPDEETAGRQLYRAGYTLVSFATLLSALASYLASTEVTAANTLPASLHDFYFWTAAASGGVAIASLINASPLSLVPVFEKSRGRDPTDVLFLQRVDSLKLQPKGLTRITRHPLILPVVPWGIATSQLAGGRTADILLFGGLAMYALCGCAAQDLRVIRKEGSVGTVFSPTTGTEPLQDFFQSTSFVPFQAVLDGRQSLSDVLREVPWLALAGGCFVGAYTEDTLLQWLGGTTVL